MNLKKRLLAIILCCLAVGIVLHAAPPAFAQEVLNVGLLRFDAFPSEEGIRLVWIVETELGTAGYTIKRGQNGSFDHLPDPSGNGNLFILAEGGPAQGYSYDFVDTTAVRETTYTYQLFEITTGSTEEFQSEVSVIFRIEPTSTPITFSGGIGGPGSGGNQGGAATATATQPPTATPRPQIAATSAPPPTVVAPTPLPSPTVVQPTSVPVVTAPLQPAASPPPDTAYPAAAISAPDANGVEEAGSSLPYLEDAAAQESVTEYPMTAIAAPEEKPAESSSGIASALEISGDLLASQGQQPVIRPVNGSPIVIEAAGDVSAATLIVDETQAQTADGEQADVDSSRLLLWVAFIVALAIFSASVVGAILLYSRRRPLK